ncbi:hypothetical protein HMPREF1983_01471 [Gemella bergeri ATCC 700627]|uniref:Uncharacterized protein n=1 Tax=Gemella bergeri ATCC 700627 TaxID=1321820 RepID=U2RRI3_9BACL|nr:hypothetical protein [Gemella bergeri]ERK56153.1 hypothetical protein HMPREF1983_01471 [Gemella bergeri ATCC 700627]
MSRLKNLYGYGIAILVFYRLMFNVREISQITFSQFIRYDMHKIFDEDRQIIIEQVILLLALYMAFFHVYSKVLSVNIENFKKMMRYKCTSILDLEIKTFSFFFKIFFKDAVIFLFVLIIEYMFKTKDINLYNYYHGIVDIAKLP